jgi:preprotein translocase subunit SecA
LLMTVEVRDEAQLEEAETPPQLAHVEFHHDDFSGPEAAEVAAAKKPVPAHVLPKVGRNEPCPCGSGKKYKHCHGKLN